MTIIIFLIGISLTIAIVFVLIFYLTLKSGQYDDTYTPSVRMLFDSKTADATGNRESVNKKATAKKQEQRI